MCAPISPEELSAYLDGELDPERREQVRLALARDPQIRRDYEQLAAFDRRWSRAAARAQFPVQWTAPASRREFSPMVPAIVLALLIVVRLGTKAYFSMTGTLLVSSLALAGLLFLLMRLAQETGRVPSNQTPQPI